MDTPQRMKISTDIALFRAHSVDTIHTERQRAPIVQKARNPHLQGAIPRHTPSVVHSDIHLLVFAQYVWCASLMVLVEFVNATIQWTYFLKLRPGPES